MNFASPLSIKLPGGVCTLLLLSLFPRNRGKRRDEYSPASWAWVQFKPLRVPPSTVQSPLLFGPDAFKTLLMKTSAAMVCGADMRQTFNTNFMFSQAFCTPLRIPGHPGNIPEISRQKACFARASRDTPIVEALPLHMADPPPCLTCFGATFSHSVLNCLRCATSSAAQSRK